MSGSSGGRRAWSRWDPRTRLVVGNAMAAGIVKGGSMLIALAMVPAYLRFFEDKGSLGAWLAAISMVNWFLTVDLGIGNGMRNSIVASMEGRDWGKVRDQVAGAYGAALGIVLVVSPLAGLLVTLVDWSALLGAPTSDSSGSLQQLVAWLMVTIGLQFVLRTVTFVLYGLQRSALTNVLALTTSLTLLVFVLGASVLPRGTRVELLGPAYAVAVNLPLVVVTVWVFAVPLARTRPYGWSKFWVNVPAALSSGRSFFANQLLFTALLGTSAFMVARVAGSAGVVEYQAHYTLFSLVGVVAMLGLTPVWSAVTQAIVVKDYDWVARTLARAEVAATAASLVIVLLAVCLAPLLELWLGRGVVQPTLLTTAAFVVFGYGFLMHGVVATFAAGLSKLRLQLAFYGLGFGLKVLVVYLAVSRTQTWAIVPAIDGVVLIAYYLTERHSLRSWLRQSREAPAPRGADPSVNDGRVDPIPAPPTPRSPHDAPN